MAAPVVTSAVSAAYSAVPEKYRAQALDWVKKASGGVVTSAKSMANFAKSSDAAAVTVAEGLVRNGAPVNAVEAIFSNLANAAQVRANLIALGRQLISSEDQTRPGLNSSVPDLANDQLRKELVACLTRAFGSVAQARKVQLALFTLRESDFNWYEGLFPSR